MNTIARNAIYAATVITLWPFALSAQPRLGAPTSDCPPLLAPQFARMETNTGTSVVSMAAAQNPVAIAGVEFQMHAGRLKPQLERLLRQHMAVQHIVWQVAEEHEWPSSFVLQGKSWPALTESLLAPYQLRLQLFANHSAVITYQSPTETSGRGGL